MERFRQSVRVVMFVVGLPMVVSTCYWVISMLTHVVSGQERWLAAFLLIVGAVLWVPALMIGFLLMGGWRLRTAVRQSKQLECLTCSESMPSLSLFCPHCGSEAHRSTNCHSCSAPRQANHRFCRACGAKAA